MSSKIIKKIGHSRKPCAQGTRGKSAVGRAREDEKPRAVPSLFPRKEILVAAKLTKLAGVQNSKAKQFSDDLLEIIVAWQAHACRVIQAPSIVDLYNKVFYAANSLHRLLQEVKGARNAFRNGARVPIEHRALLEPLRKEHVLLLASRQLIDGLRAAPRKISISDLLASLSVLAKVAKDEKKMMTSAQGRGRPRGIKNYPGLNRLIFELEYRARAADGGFHVNNRDRKGSMLDALDLLRTYFMNEPELNWLGPLLPPPDRHPVSTYQRIIKSARGVYDYDPSS
jgi:hypothetical protein